MNREDSCHIRAQNEHRRNSASVGGTDPLLRGTLKGLGRRFSVYHAKALELNPAPDIRDKCGVIKKESGEAIQIVIALYLNNSVC